MKNCIIFDKNKTKYMWANQKDQKQPTILVTSIQVIQVTATHFGISKISTITLNSHYNI